MIRVYDFDHSPFDGPGTPYHDMAWLRDIFGDIQVHPIEEHMTLQEGQLVAKVVWFDCKVGDTAAIIHVEQDGAPKAGVVGIFGWPDADQHGLPEDWPLWTANGAVGEPTRANGDAGLGSYGQGAYYGPAEGERGPHFIWLHTVPSDMVDGLGMLTWAEGVEGNHLHVNIGYEIVAYDGEEPPSPEPGEPGEILARLDRIISDAGWVRDRLAEVDVLAEELADAL